MADKCDFAPKGCTDHCLVEWDYKNLNEERALFAMFANNLRDDQYVAIAFSNDTKLGDDVIFACLYGGKFPFAGFITEKGIVGLFGAQIDDKKSVAENGTKMCGFTIPHELELKAPQLSGKKIELTFNNDTDYYVLVLKGLMSEFYQQPNGRIQDLIGTSKEKITFERIYQASGIQESAIKAEMESLEMTKIFGMPQPIFYLVLVASIIIVLAIIGLMFR